MKELRRSTPAGPPSTRRHTAWCRRPCTPPRPGRALPRCWHGRAGRCPWSRSSAGSSSRTAEAQAGRGSVGRSCGGAALEQVFKQAGKVVSNGLHGGGGGRRYVPACWGPSPPPEPAPATAGRAAGRGGAALRPGGNWCARRDAVASRSWPAAPRPGRQTRRQPAAAGGERGAGGRRLLAVGVSAGVPAAMRPLGQKGALIDGLPAVLLLLGRAQAGLPACQPRSHRAAAGSQSGAGLHRLGRPDAFWNPGRSQSRQAASAACLR